MKSSTSHQTVLRWEKEMTKISQYWYWGHDLNINKYKLIIIYSLYESQHFLLPLGPLRMPLCFDRAHVWQCRYVVAVTRHLETASEMDPCWKPFLPWMIFEYQMLILFLSLYEHCNVNDHLYHDPCCYRLIQCQVAADWDGEGAGPVTATWMVHGDFQSAFYLDVLWPTRMLQGKVSAPTKSFISWGNWALTGLVCWHHSCWAGHLL